MKILNDIVKTTPAVAPVTSSFSSASMTPIAIDTTGYNRARFVFNFGVPLANASFYAIVYQGTSSAGYISVPATSFALSSVTNSAVAVVDMQVSSGTPWLILSGSMAHSSNWPCSVTVDLYQGMNRSRQAVAAAVLSKITIA
jgi:hypothetical protein